jgi:drug/metabolite transporter (DMT)-like permease
VSNLNLFIVCVLIWGTTWLAITFQLGHVSPEMSVGYRFIIASALLFAFCAAKKESLRFDLRQHIDLALFGAAMFCLSYIFVYNAELYIISGMVAVAYSASPMINMWLSRLFFGTPVTSQVTAAAMLGIIGICFVFYPEMSKLNESKDLMLGLVLTVLSVFASSAGSMVAMRTQRRGYATWPSMAWGMLYGGVLSILYAMIVGKPFLFEWTFPYVSTLIYLAIFGSVITFGCYLTLLKRIGAARASYVGVMVPVVALIISHFFESYKWQWTTTVGIILLVIGNVLMLRAPRAAVAEPTTT